MTMRGFGAFLRRLRGQSLVRRWNFHYTVKDQTVDAHSYWVAIYAMVLADIENEWLAPEAKYDANEVIRGALLHDWEESITGDLPSLVKRTCREEWSRVEDIAFNQLVAPIECTVTRRDYRNWWLLSRSKNAKVGKLIHAADLLDRLAYAYDEQQRGNKAFDHIVMETTHQLVQLRFNSVDEILKEWGHREGMALPDLMTHL